MEDNERVFRHSFGKRVMMFLAVLLFGFLAFSMNKIDYFMVIATGFVLLADLSYATSSVRVSSEEITTRRLLGSKTIRWSEIARISTRGQALRLHNRDEDLTVSLDSQLDDYPQILDVIFSKRPDLIDSGEDDLLSRSWWHGLMAIGFGLLIIAISIFVFSVSDDSGFIYSLIFLLMGMFVIGSWFLSPQSVLLEENNLLVMYLFKEVSHRADDIALVSLEKRRTKNGYIYFVQVNLKSGKKIKLPTFKQGVALTYQIIKRWHMKATQKAETYSV